MRRSSQDETISEISDDQSSSEWQPEMRICLINLELLQRISGVVASRLSELTSLDLHLKDGQLGKIRTIENLHFVSNLEVLNLSYNAITVIEGLDSLTRLVELNLAENAISKIENIFHLSQLQRLNLSGNSISELPADMVQLSSLTTLRISRNKISRVDDMSALMHLDRLTNLRCDGNPLSSSRSRLALVYLLPTLTVLDNETISAAERLAARDARDNTHLKTLRSSLMNESVKVASSSHPRTLLGLSRYTAQSPPRSAPVIEATTQQVHHAPAVVPPKDVLSAAATKRSFVGISVRERNLETPQKHESVPTTPLSREARTPSAGDARIEKLGARIVAIEKEKSSLVEENEELKSEVTELRQELQIAHQEYQSLQREHSRLLMTESSSRNGDAALVIEKDKRIKNLEHIVSDVTSSHEKAKAELQRLASQLTVKEEEIEALGEAHRNNTSALMGRLENLQHEFELMIQSKDRAMNDLESLQRAKVNYLNDAKQLQNRVEQGDAEIIRLREQLQERELAIKSRDMDIKHLQQELSSVRTARNNKVAWLQHSSNTNRGPSEGSTLSPLDVLSGFIFDRLSEASAHKDMRSISLHLAQELMSDAAQSRNLPPLPDDSSSDMSDLLAEGMESQHDGLDTRLKRHFVSTVDADELIYRRREVQTLKDTISELENVEQQIQEKIRRSQEAATLIEAETMNARREAETALKEIESLMRRLTQAKSEFEKVQLQCQSKTAELQSIERAIHDAESYHAEEQQKIENQAQRIAALNKDMIKLQDTISDLARRRQEETSQYNAIKSKAADEIAVLQSQAEGISRNIRDLLQQKHELETHISSSEEQVIRHRTTSEREIQNRRKELEDVISSVSEAKSRLAKHQLDLERVQEVVRSQEASFVQMTQARNNQILELEAQEKEKISRIASLTAECSTLENRYKNAVQQCANAVKDAEDTSCSLEMLRQERKHLENNIESKRQALSEELRQVNADIETAQRKLRQLGIASDQKSAELDSKSSEVRMLENRAEEYQRNIKLLEQQLDNSRSELQNINGQISRVRDMIQAQKSEETELRLKLQYMKTSKEADIRAADECKQRIEMLQEKESAMHQSHTQLEAELSTLKHAIGVHRKDLEALRSSTDIEKARASEAQETRTARSLECKQLEQRLQHMRNEYGEEEKRVLEMKHTQQLLGDDLSQLQREIVAAKRNLDECARREAEYHKRDLGLEQLRRKVQAEVQSLHDYFETEKRQLHTLKTDRDAVILELKDARDKLTAVNNELQSTSENLGHYQHQVLQYTNERDALIEELADIRQRIESDSKRSDELIHAFRSLEKQLSQLRHEISAAEACFQEAKARAAVEEAKAEQCRSAAANTALELERLESAIAKSCDSFHDERLRALVDISQLEITRSALLGNMQMLSESRQRACRIVEHNVTKESSTIKNKSAKVPTLSAVESIPNPISSTENCPPSPQHNHDRTLRDEMDKLQRETERILKESRNEG